MITITRMKDNMDIRYNNNHLYNFVLVATTSVLLRPSHGESPHHSTCSSTEARLATPTRLLLQWRVIAWLSRGLRFIHRGCRRRGRRATLGLFRLTSLLFDLGRGRIRDEVGWEELLKGYSAVVSLLLRDIAVGRTERGGVLAAGALAGRT